MLEKLTILLNISEFEKKIFSSKRTNKQSQMA